MGLYKKNKDMVEKRRRGKAQSEGIVTRQSTLALTRSLLLLALLACMGLSEHTVQAGTFVQEKSQNKTLVLVDTWATIETHSIFFEHIKTMGGGNHTLEFKLISGKPTDPVGIQ